MVSGYMFRAEATALRGSSDDHISLGFGNSSARSSLRCASARFIDALRAEIDRPRPLFILPILAPQENSSTSIGWLTSPKWGAEQKSRRK